MGTREAVQATLMQLLSDMSLHEFAREIEFIAAVREGMAELDRGEGIPADQVREELKTCLELIHDRDEWRLAMIGIDLGKLGTLREKIAANHPPLDLAKWRDTPKDHARLRD
ncbi:MAG: hypothetical protein Q8N18_11795 [Opitutaceae bacterium]|nr:hypothetical protein [Opitutaceae bacterium]